MAYTYSSTPVLSKIKLGTETYYVKDKDVRAIIDTYGDIVTHNVATSVSDTTAGVVATASQVKTYVDTAVAGIHQFEYAIYDTLPEASASTMYIIALVPEEGTVSGTYVEYLTIRNGAEGSYTYAWEKIGSTHTDLSDYLKDSATVAGVSFGSDKAISVAEMSTALDLNSLAHKSQASGTYATVSSAATPSTAITGATASVTTTATDITLTGSLVGGISGSISGKTTAAGSVAVTNSYAPTAAKISTYASYTPAGSVAVAVSTATADAVLSYSDYTPEGTVSVSLSNSSFNHITSVGTLPTYTVGSYTAPSVNEATGSFATAGVVAAMDSTDTEMLVLSAATLGDALTSTGFAAGSYTAPTYTAGTLPTMSEMTVSVSSASFTGTKQVDAIVKNASYVAVTSENITATFTGTAANNVIPATIYYDKANESASATFTGQEADVTGTFAVAAADMPTVSVSGKYDKANASAAVTATVPAMSVAITPGTATVTVA